MTVGGPPRGCRRELLTVGVEWLSRQAQDPWRVDAFLCGCTKLPRPTGTTDPVGRKPCSRIPGVQQRPESWECRCAGRAWEPHFLAVAGVAGLGRGVPGGWHNLQGPWRGVHPVLQGLLWGRAQSGFWGPRLIDYRPDLFGWALDCGTQGLDQAPGLYH